MSKTIEASTVHKVDQHERRIRNRSGLKRFIHGIANLQHSDSRLYWFYRLTGRQYSDYYAARMNRIAEKDPVAATGCPEEKMFQLNYLIENGMQPHHRFLDFGCGTGSAAVNFVRYLEPQNYTGIDIASECIRIAQKRIADHDLLDQQPNFHWINGDAAGPLQDQKFDVIWAQSVLTHMPPEDISSLLQTVEKFMHSESRFFATFAHTPAEPRHHRYKDWYYNAEFFSELTENSPLSCRIMDTWAHPNSSIDRMLCFERRHNEQAEAA